MKKLRLAGRTLTVTPVFDTYWRFAARRHEIFMKRVRGEAPPWTEDEVLAGHRFTNVFRASDRVSQYLIKNVAYAGSQDPSEVFFRVVLFKIFNKVETWEALRARLGDISWHSFDIDAMDGALNEARERGESIYSAAYIMPSPALGAERKHTNHLRLIARMMKEALPARIHAARSLAEVYELLVSYPSIGRFLAFQLAIDLNYSALTNFSEMDFVVAGPGARDGVRKCFEDTDGLDEEDVIKVMADVAAEQFARLGLRFEGLWGRPLQLIDCQNLFCEVDKYARVMHPDIAGVTGRSRIKQKFAPAARAIPQWYPPKWGINLAMAELDGARVAA